MASFIKSQTGREKLVFDGFIYQMQRIGKNKRYWQCENWKRKKVPICPGRAVTDEQNNVKLTKEHNHEPSATRLEVMKIKNTIKQASATKAGAVDIVNTILAGASDQAKELLPKNESLHQLVKRGRKMNDAEKEWAGRDDADNIQVADFDSVIWRFFARELGGDVSCQLCPKVLTINSGSTRSLWGHLKTKHKEEFAQIRPNQEAAGASSSKKAARRDYFELDDLLDVVGHENPQTGEPIQVMVTAGVPYSTNGMLAGTLVNTPPSANTSRVAITRSPTASHILVWTCISHQQNNPTYILANLMDDGHNSLRRAGEISIEHVIHQKLGACPEPASCCFSTGIPVNIVLKEFSSLGYKTIGMTNKGPNEVLWTLAK